MNYHDIEKTIEELKKPEVTTPGYKWALKRQLLAKHKRAGSRLSLTQFITMNINKFLIGGVGVAFVFAFVFLAPQANSPEALAAELVEKAQHRTLSLSLKERMAIEERIQGDMVAILEEAEAAPDLVLIDAEEFKMSMKDHGSIALRGIEGAVEGLPTMEVTVGDEKAFKAEAMALEGGDMATPVAEYRALPTAPMSDVSVPAGTWTTEGTAAESITIQFKPPVQYLRYTDADMRQVTLGLDEDNTPVIMFIDAVFTEEHSVL